MRQAIKLESITAEGDASAPKNLQVCFQYNSNLLSSILVLVHVFGIYKS